MDLEHLEALALADDRDAALAALVPGSPDHDAWSVIHLQHRGDLDAADAILARWRVRSGEDARWRALRRRQLLFRADRDLPAHADDLASELGATLDHAREGEHEASPHPTALDPALLDEARLLARAVRRDRGLGGVRDEGLPALLATDDAHVRRAALGRLTRGGAPGLVDAIARELGEKASKGFGSLEAHRHLSLAELDALADRIPALRADRAFVEARLTRLRPPPHVDLQDPDARAAHLDRLWTEVEPLPPVFNDLKGHVLLHRLALDRRRGAVDRGRLLALLRLPRRAAYLRSEWSQGLDPRHVLPLDRDLSAITGLGPPEDEEALVRALLAELLRTEDGSPFAETVDRRWLDLLLAEARLLDGDPDVERWTTILGPERTAALRDRVELEIRPSTPRRWGRDAAVALDVDLKNAWPLRIRVYRVHVAAWAARHGGDVPLDVDLDGLAPGWEAVEEAAPVSPMRRVRRAIPLPACDRPGTWVIELVGQGRASRVLLHKGHLRCATRPSAAGLEVTVLDEEGRDRPEARVHLGPRETRADDDGVVRLPFGAGGPVDVLLVEGELVVPDVVELPAEDPTFRAHLLLDRQALIGGREARALLRPELRIGEAAAPLDLLEDPWVEVTTVDRAGVPAARRQPLELSDDGEAEVAIVVPERLARLTIAVGGRIRLVSRQRTEDLRDERAIAVATMDATEATETAVLTRDAEGWWLHVLGKTGEPRPGREVRVDLSHRLVTDPVEATLATDADGRIRLGALPGVTRLDASVSGGALAAFDLEIGGGGPATRVVREGDPVRIPASDLREVRVVELRGGAPAHDHTALARREPGSARIEGLPAGEHRVRIDGDEVAITVLPSTLPVAAGFATLPGRILEVPPPPALLAEVELGDELRVRVEHATPRTRVHVVVTPAWIADAGADLAVEPRPPVLRPIRDRGASWVCGRDLGDEARYVLDRRRLPHRPGSMLERPTLLIQPWALRTTTTEVLVAQKADAWSAGAPAPAPMGMAGGAARMSAAAMTGANHADPAFTSWEFLAEAPVVLANLVPDADGEVRVPADRLGRGAVVRVLCVDPSATTARVLARSPATLPARDLRLAEALPEDRHLREERLLVAGGAPGARAAVIDTIEPLYRALCALGGHPELAAWDFLPRWATLSREAKLELWDRHGCHELALFVRQKDPALFEEALRPALACRLEPTFLDVWLVGGDVRGWLAPAKLARLNALERALLARSVPEARESLARALADEVDLQVPDRAADDRLVETLLAGGDREPAPSPPPPPQEEVLAQEADEAPRAAKVPPRSRAPSRERAARDEARPLYRPADATKEWAEHRWWHTRLADLGPAVVPPARIWRDLAAHREGPFLPTHLSEVTTSFAACVGALALIDLPLVAGGGPTLVATAALVPAEGAPAGDVLVGQATFRADDRWAWDGAERREKPVGDEIVAGVVHVTDVVVTNPTARGRRLAVLLQVPEGAVPVAGGIATRTTRLELGPYATGTVQVAWTCPFPGTFRHAGARVTEGERLVAAAPGRSFAVVRVPTGVDPGSWPHLSQRGTLDEVVAFLATRPLGRVDLSRVAWRLRDREAFARVTAALARRHVVDDVLWAYGLLHHDRDAVRTWLSRQSALLAEVGPLDLDLCRFHPVDAGLEEHLEYAPLINARAHRLGGRRKLPNEGLAARWERFLTRVATQPAPSAADRLVAAQALLTMDRPDEAAAQLRRVPRDATAAALQHDALTAWLALLEGDLAAARPLVAAHARTPLPRWARRFGAMRAVLDELDGGARPPVDRESRDAVMGELAATEPSLVARLEDGALVIDSANLASARLRAWGMDVELLFSRQPFFDGGRERFALVDPQLALDLVLDPSGRTRVPLPEAIRGRDTVLEVASGPHGQLLTSFSNDLAATVSAAYGQLLVRRASTGRPLPAAYVKAFARRRDGSVVFHKDGYTDLRGRFDYATLSTDVLDRVERFAMLVVHDEAGALVLQGPPPVR